MSEIGALEARRVIIMRITDGIHLSADLSRREENKLKFHKLRLVMINGWFADGA
jgi:hypothetical protein